MKKVKIIVGKRNSGKSTIAKAMVSSIKDSQKAFIDPSSLNNPFCFSECHERTLVIVIDELKDPEYLLTVIFSSIDGIKVDKKSKALFVIHPEIIIVCNEWITKERLLEMGSSILRRIEIIETLN